MGRKRKNGKREKNGRLQRQRKDVVAMAYDRGSDYTMAMQALYGQDGCDAIGRAYRTGLLGDGSDAKAMLDMARQISNAYWSAYETGRYTCAIADKTSGSASSISPDKAQRREDWLNGCLDTIKTLGRAHRAAFDQLVINVYPDHGPRFLDRMIHASKSKAVMIDPADATQLDLALEALAAVTGVEKPGVPRLKAA